VNFLFNAEVIFVFDLCKWRCKKCFSVRLYKHLYLAYQLGN